MSNIQQDPDLDSIQRCPHDADNPYTMVLNALLRNKNLTPNCRWLLSYLLSNDKGWKIKPKQIMNHLESHMKKDSVYKIINEAIEAGYMRKEEIRNNGKFGGCKYFISETPKFKKSLPRLEIPDTVLSDPVKPTLKKEKEIKNNQIDDDDRVRENEEKISKNENLDVIKFNTKGHSIHTSQSDIFRYFVGKSYSTETIKEAIKRTQSAQGAINNVLRFIESVCEQIDSQNAKESVSKKSIHKSKVPSATERVIVPRVKSNGSFEEALKLAKENLKNKGN